MGSRQVGSNEGGSPGSDTEAVDGSDTDDETDSKLKPFVDTHGANTTSC
jgi:hypothetical protein